MLNAVDMHGTTPLEAAALSDQMDICGLVGCFGGEELKLGTCSFVSGRKKVEKYNLDDGILLF